MCVWGAWEVLERGEMDGTNVVINKIKLLRYKADNIEKNSKRKGRFHSKTDWHN